MNIDYLCFFFFPYIDVSVGIGGIMFCDHNGQQN